jgi:hypothetical protein
MKDHLHELVSQTATAAEAGLMVREYLQARDEARAADSSALRLR